MNIQIMDKENFAITETTASKLVSQILDGSGKYPSRGFYLTDSSIVFTDMIGHGEALMAVMMTDRAIIACGCADYKEDNGFVFKVQEGLKNLETSVRIQEIELAFNKEVIARK